MGEPDKTNLTAVISVINDHIPSLTEKAEAAIDLAYLGAENGIDYADAAIRECKCGVMLDGVYEYVDHLKAVLRQELTDA